MASLLERIKGKREEIKINRAGQARAYKFKPGKTVISLLPLHAELHLPVEERNYFRQFGMHYIKNAKGENIVAVGDRSITYGEPCPVRDGLVDMIRYANSIGDDDMAEAAKKSLARTAYLMNGIVHQDPDGKKSDDPELFSFSESLADQLFSILEEYLAENPDALLRWNDRLLFVVEREGTTMTDTKYKIYPAAAKKNVDPSIMTKAVNLEEYAQAQFAESVQKALTFISTSTGKSLSGSSLAAALTAPVGAATPKLVDARPAASPEAEEDLLAAAPTARTAAAPALAKAVAEDAVFEDVTAAAAPAPAPAPTAAASADDLLAEIDGLAA